tara:strand:- start:1680 stop:2804 length:1125 start_codon:yes stop_codon:yes gene_type:complete
LKKGFSLPIWVVAAAKAALKKLNGLPFDNYELIILPDKKYIKKIKVHSVALINNNQFALAITFVDSGLDLDLTQNLEIWTLLSLKKTYKENDLSSKKINLIAGYGVGINSLTSEISISNFAREILDLNLLDQIPSQCQLNLEIIFPNGKFLAERTSNKSFGIVDGLSIIGTTAETHLSASPDQITNAKEELSRAVENNYANTITFVIGENGLDLAKKIDIRTPVIKVGNWIGPLLVFAATKNIHEILILGYHGKLIKLAGGIFHTHNHLADARVEILVCLAVREKLPSEIISHFVNCKTIDESLKILEKFNIDIANNFWVKIANEIEQKSKNYINKYISTDIKVGAVLFDRDRNIRWAGNNGQSIFSNTCTFQS